MERSLPTDPPDEPVNRIKQFFDLEESSAQWNLPLPFQVPVYMIGQITEVLRVQKLLLEDLGRDPTPEEIAEKVNLPVMRVRAVLRLNSQPPGLFQNLSSSPVPIEVPPLSPEVAEVLHQELGVLNDQYESDPNDASTVMKKGAAICN